MRTNITRPKRNKRKVICDSCQFEYSVKDVTKVTDSYNRQYGLVVCKICKQKPNPQDRPFTCNEVILTNTELVRPEPGTTYAVNENDDRLPGKPSDGIIKLDPFDNILTLFWQPPSDQGSSLISGYIIQRANPQHALYITIEDNTNTSVCTYQDLTADLSAEYTYIVAAINGFGTGPYSDPIFWPKDLGIFEDVDYLIDEFGNSIIDESSYSIRTNYSDHGII